jgi:hypothetical protein
MARTRVRLRDRAYTGLIVTSTAIWDRAAQGRSWTRLGIRRCLRVDRAFPTGPLNISRASDSVRGGVQALSLTVQQKGLFSCF